MTIKRLIFLVIAISTFTDCRRGYKVEDGKVYYQSWNEGSGQNKWFIEKADAAIFEALEFDCGCDFHFGKDKTYLFIDGEPMKGIDPTSFRFIGNYTFRDKDSAYFFGFFNNINNCVIKGVDPDKLKLIKYPWSKADNILIHGGDTLSLDDVNDFVVIDEDWGRTKKYVINCNKLLKEADPETFKVINSYTGRDKRHLYEFGKIKE